MMMSKYFDFDNLTATSHDDLIQRNKIEANSFMANLSELAETILDPLRERFGPFIISSAFRGKSLNLRVGGSPTSQHCNGQAADLCRPDWGWKELDGICTWIAKDSGLKFGQLIREKHGDAVWLHISLGEKREALDFNDGKYTRRMA